MVRSILAFSHALDWLARRGAGFCLALMLFFMAVQVVARYAFNEPPSWTEEMARFMMVWVGLLGATLSFKSKADPILFHDPAEHKAFPWRLLTGIVRGVAVVLFVVPVIYFSIYGPGMDMSRGFIARQAGLSADSLGFPMSWVVISVPIWGSIILVHLAARACEIKLNK
ncbi:TRAP transporter small permease subunit [uncultured Marinobacter sp.]|uniref:TRAP transporter small permease n=1 Tax=uncultured Marinobacter sp. TaxID=187379 RepID=UPI0025D9414F|nr:TRAP transporter small permease subunit [uncultured Marinobacter sp.]